MTFSFRQIHDPSGEVQSTTAYVFDLLSIEISLAMGTIALNRIQLFPLLWLWRRVSSSLLKVAMRALAQQLGT
jgi:hypothetical protein